VNCEQTQTGQYFTLIGVRNIAISMSACVSVCPSVGISLNRIAKLHEIFSTCCL